MTTLTFQNEELARLARITNIHGFGKEQPFNLPYTEETTNEAGFLLVKDDGIYLMNAFKHDNCTGKDAEGNRIEVNVVSYADGFDPKTNENVWEDSHDISGDDFAEFIPVSKEMLITLGRNIGKMKIKLTETSITVQVTRTSY